MSTWKERLTDEQFDLISGRWLHRERARMDAEKEREEETVRKKPIFAERNRIKRMLPQIEDAISFGHHTDAQIERMQRLCDACYVAMDNLQQEASK